MLLRALLSELRTPSTASLREGKRTAVLIMLGGKARIWVFVAQEGPWRPWGVRELGGLVRGRMGWMKG
jgi:hypothetical protein